MADNQDVQFEWRGKFTNDEVNALHAEAFDHRPFDDDWVAQLAHFSLGWVVARDGVRLVGFVNVAWDGGVHAFILDTMVATSHLRKGIATELVTMSVTEGKRAGCEWLHVDFDPHLRDFYFGACSFEPTDAGLISLTS